MQKRQLGHSYEYFPQDRPMAHFGTDNRPVGRGCVPNARSSNPVLASMYGVALVGTWFDLAIFGSGALVTLQHWFF